MHAGHILFRCNSDMGFVSTFFLQMKYMSLTLEIEEASIHASMFKLFQDIHFTHTVMTSILFGVSITPWSVFWLLEYK